MPSLMSLMPSTAPDSLLFYLPHNYFACGGHLFSGAAPFIPLRSDAKYSTMWMCGGLRACRDPRAWQHGPCWGQCCAATGLAGLDVPITADVMHSAADTGLVVWVRGCVLDLARARRPVGQLWLMVDATMLACDRAATHLRGATRSARVVLGRRSRSSTGLRLLAAQVA